MKNAVLIIWVVLLGCFANSYAYEMEGLPLYYWHRSGAENFGDHLSLKLVERIVGGKIVDVQQRNIGRKKLLAIGSVLSCARSGDIVWGTGMNAKRVDAGYYPFEHLDIRAIRGPLTRDFLQNTLGIYCPEIYGDPALLIPYFFPEFKKKKNPKYDYIIIPHYSDEDFFPKSLYPNAVYSTEPYADIIRKILDSKFVISSSLHGIVVAEAYGIPARYIRVSENEPLFKYADYYLGTNRPYFSYATSIEEALAMGGEPPFECDLEKLYQSFPFEYWPHANFKTSILNGIPK